MYPKKKKKNTVIGITIIKLSWPSLLGKVVGCRHPEKPRITVLAVASWPSFLLLFLLIINFPQTSVFLACLTIRLSSD